MLPSLPFSNSKVTKFPFKLSKKHGLNRETLCHCTTTTPPCHCKSMLLPPLMFFYSRITKFSFHTCQQPRGLDRETSRHHTISPPQVCISRKIESLGWGCFCGNQVSKKEGSKRYSILLIIWNSVNLHERTYYCIGSLEELFVSSHSHTMNLIFIWLVNFLFILLYRLFSICK
ncbi:hypothetical protein AAZX31_14G055600 [Glycine max]